MRRHDTDDMIQSLLKPIYTRSASFFIDTRRGSILLLLLLSAGSYANTLGHDFVWDDRILILHNPYVQDIRLLGEGLTSDFWKSYEDPRRFRQYYRPVVTVTYFLDYSLWGENPSGYHITNLLVHTSNVILLFLSSLFLFEQRGAAVLAAALFAVHPVHTESVSWISGRTDLLASLFVLLSFYSYLRLSREPSRRLWLYGMHVAYVLALLSKEVAILLPVALALHLLWLNRTRGDERRFLRRVIAVQGVLGLGFLLFRYFVLQMPLLIESRRPISMLALNMPRILARYLEKLVAPVKLYAHDPMVWVTVERWPLLLIAVGVLAGTTLLLVKLGREDRRSTYGCTWCLLFLLPVLNAGTFTDVIVAERFVYLPSVGFCWVIGTLYILAQEKGFPRKALAAAAMLLVLVAGWETWHRNPVWKDPMTLFQEMVRNSPHYPLPHTLLGEAYQNAGNPEAALACYRRALELGLDNCRLLNAIALAQLERGVMRESAQVLEDGFRFALNALDRCRDEDVLHHTLGEYYLRQRNITLAVEQFKEAIAINPYNPGYYYNIGAVLFASGRQEEARPYLEEFVRRAPRGAERRQAAEWLRR